MTFPLFVAYNREDYKVGCALVQPMLGGTLTGGDLAFHFDTDKWELNPSKCKVYRIENEEEFEKMKLLTNSK